MAKAKAVALGEVQMHLAIENGKIRIQFDRDTQLIVFEPANALELCERLADMAYQARGSIPVADGALKHELVERNRKTLTTRLALMLNSLREDKSYSTLKLAQVLVDTCLKQVY